MKPNSLAVTHMCRYMRGKDRRTRIERYKRQRINRGFCDVDVWNMDTYLNSLIPAMLERLVEDPAGYPCTYNSIEEWRSKVLSIANDFREIERLDKMNPDEAGVADFKALGDLIETTKNRAFDALKEVFFDLWD